MWMEKRNNIESLQLNFKDTILFSIIFSKGNEWTEPKDFCYNHPT